MPVQRRQKAYKTKDNSARKLLTPNCHLALVIGGGGNSGCELKGLKIIIPDAEQYIRTALNTLRYCFHEVLTKFGNPNCPALERPKGLTTKALMNEFGFTYYFANNKLRREAIKILEECMPACLVGKVKISRTYRSVSQGEFERRVNTVRVHQS